MPKKVRELKAMVARVGYILQPGRGKGSHTFWKHPLLPEEPLTIFGKDGDDAPLYLERGIQRVLKKLELLETLVENEEDEGGEE
ncbi:MAG: type II toxin-antitoxin system HicA family toxin [Rhizonema sp. PD38]|nr:type II toxin-antitoxin system HicA family toxin [Rhizonema sp. PD38]